MNAFFSERARAHLEDIAAWYEEQRPGEGGDFKAALLSCVELFALFPAMHPLYHGRVRRALLSSHPYFVYYLVERDHVEVLAVIHQSRRPDAWRVRDAERYSMPRVGTHRLG